MKNLSKIILGIIIINLLLLSGCQTLDQWHENQENNQPNLNLNIERTIQSIKTMIILTDNIINFIETRFGDDIPIDIQIKLDEIQDILNQLNNLLVFIESFQILPPQG